MVIVTVKDHAKNEGTERVELRELVGSDAQPKAAPAEITQAVQRPAPQSVGTPGVAAIVHNEHQRRRRRQTPSRSRLSTRSRRRP